MLGLPFSKIVLFGINDLFILFLARSSDNISSDLSVTSKNLGSAWLGRSAQPIPARAPRSVQFQQNVSKLSLIPQAPPPPPPPAMMKPAPPAPSMFSFGEIPVPLVRNAMSSSPEGSPPEPALGLSRRLPSKGSPRLGSVPLPGGPPPPPPPPPGAAGPPVPLSGKSPPPPPVPLRSRTRGPMPVPQSSALSSKGSPPPPLPVLYHGSRALMSSGGPPPPPPPPGAAGKRLFGSAPKGRNKVSYYADLAEKKS